MADPYFSLMLPYARRASQETGLAVSLILAQWGNESGRGKSDLAIYANNHAGIKHVSVPTQDWRTSGGYAAYRTLDGFVDDYVRVLKLSFYRSVAQAGSPDAQARALAETPYAESGYGGGEWLISIMKSENLYQFDSAPPSSSLLPDWAVTLASQYDLAGILPAVAVVGVGLVAVALLLPKPQPQE